MNQINNKKSPGYGLPSEIDAAFYYRWTDTLYVFRNDKYWRAKYRRSTDYINDTYTPLDRFNGPHCVEQLNEYFPKKVNFIELNGLNKIRVFSGWKYFEVEISRVKTFEANLNSSKFEWKWIPLFKSSIDSFKRKGFKDFDDFVKRIRANPPIVVDKYPSKANCIRPKRSTVEVITDKSDDKTEEQITTDSKINNSTNTTEKPEPKTVETIPNNTNSDQTIPSTLTNTTPVTELDSTNVEMETQNKCPTEEAADVESQISSLDDSMSQWSYSSHFWHYCLLIVGLTVTVSIIIGIAITEIFITDY